MSIGVESLGGAHNTSECEVMRLGGICSGPTAIEEELGVVTYGAGTS